MTRLAVLHLYSKFKFFMFFLLFFSMMLKPQFLDRLITAFLEFAISAGFCGIITAGKR